MEEIHEYTKRTDNIKGNFEFKVTNKMDITYYKDRNIIIYIG